MWIPSGCRVIRSEYLIVSGLVDKYEDDTGSTVFSIYLYTVGPASDKAINQPSDLTNLAQRTQRG